MPIQSSELILNPDGSIYHLNLRPENLALDVIFVGDQDRVEQISEHFDTVEFTTQKREFKTHTGTYKGKRISVISTGIGPDNIDIVLNELDALVNIDFETRLPKAQHTALNIVRVGTSGSLHADLPVDHFLLSQFGIGMDNMLRSYELKGICEDDMEEAFIAHTQWNSDKGRPYIVRNSPALEACLSSDEVHYGITATAGGFYGAQGRVLRLALADSALNSKIDSFSYNGQRTTNLEMETAAIYGLAKLLGHQAVSLNAIIANRADGTFSNDPYKAVRALIQYTLKKLTE
ncbi:nucleoside phosphorylase [Flavobacterium sp. JP2137]|uniref:nucleoside phosphorylase n=1 Tax=Flavobacterium sp. JP2137 TaxID=3414510 RepID=UPI003D2FF554